MSDEHILEGSDAAERPLLSYRQSWLAWAGPVLMLLVCVALCVAGQRYMPEFFWIFAGVGALLVLLYGTLGGAAMVGILIALRQRLKEIKGGEENDASQY